MAGDIPPILRLNSGPVPLSIVAICSKSGLPKASILPNKRRVSRAKWGASGGFLKRKGINMFR